MLAAMRNLILFLTVAALAACQSPCPPASTSPLTSAPCPAADAGTPAPPAPAADAAVEPHDACWNAAQKLLELSCKDTRGRLLGGPNMSGLTWSTVCRQDFLNGAKINTTCIIGASSCAAAEACK